MAKHALRCKNDERHAPLAHGLTAQQVKILACSGRLYDLHVVAGAELEVALDAGAGVLGPLAFVSMGEKHDEAGEQLPLVFAGDDELIDDDLCAVGEVAELRLPHYQSLREIARETVFEAEDGGFGELGVVDLDAGLSGREVAKGHVLFLVDDVNENRVALVEGTAAAVLAAKADGNALHGERPKCQRFGHPVIERTLTVSHLAALLEKLLHLGVDVEAFRIFRKRVSNSQ